MKTSYFARLRQLRDEPNFCPISIARFTPKWAGHIPCYERLAPDPYMLGWDRAKYERRYETILNGLSAHEVWAQLHALAGGCEPVLLCYEAPPFNCDKWCHRELVARWFQFRLGAKVVEWQSHIEPQRAKPEQLALF